MNYITYNIASNKPLVVGFTEECNENHITFTGFEKQYEGDVSTVYLMVDDLGLYPLGPEGLEMTVDVRHTYREGRFDAILVERVADGSYCRKSTPFTYVVEHSPTVRHIAIPQTPQWQDWFGPMSELYQKVKMDYEDGKLGPKWGAIHGDINDQEDLIEKLDGDYQKKLTAGQNITITEIGDNVVISGAASNYHAGDNITIDSDNVISATDTTYSAGENISIDENNVISAVDTKAEWGDITGNIGEQEDLMNQFGILDDAIDDVADDLSDHMLDTDAHPTEAQKAEWSGKQDKLTAGEGIDITDNVISTTYADTVWGNISGDIEDQEDLTAYIATEIGKEAELRSTGDTNLTNTIQQVASNLGTHSSDTSKHVTSTEKASWTAKQDKLTAGTNITIDANNVISASGSLESVDWGDIEGDIDNQTDLKNKFDSIDGKADEIAQDLADEVTRATAKETTIEGKVDTEAARAAGEEARIEGKIDTHTSNSNIHVTAAKKSEWDAKMSEPSTEGTSGQALLTDGAGNRYWGNVASGEWGSISGDIADQTDLQEALDDLSDDISAEVTRATTKETALENTVNTHTGNTTIHVTSTEKSTWTNKQDKLTAGANITISDTGVISASGGLAEVAWGGITGTLENQTDLQNALDEKVDDVKINNTSIVTDGVANIPLGSSSNVGVVSTNQDYGVDVNASGQLQLSQATTSVIDARTNQYRPITSANLDYAVKAALTDDKGDDYTSIEQAAARERIGAVGTSHNHDDRYYTETEVDTSLNNKVDKITGKGLSTNDYSNTDKAKVDAIPTDPKYTDTTYSAGTNIDIDDDNKITAIDTTYTAGSGITISESHVISATGGGTADAIDWGHINGAISDQLDLQAALDNKSDSTHTHDNRYYTEDEMDTKLGLKSDVGHKHVKADIQDFSHTHTKSDITDFAHTHDDRYYTESEVDDLLDNKADSTHTHDDRYYTETEVDDKFTAVDTDIVGLEDEIDDIQELIPSEATSSNQLADKNFVNSSITSNTATFRGTYNSTAELPSTGITPNDYAFVIAVDTAGNTVYNRYKYTNGEWLFEYSLNNSSFTAQQWASINSGATTTNIGQIATNKTNIESIIEDVADLTSGKSDVGHTHTKSEITDFAHTHTKSQITDFAHNHDDLYYTEDEVDTLLGGKADAVHSHNDLYYTESEVDTKLSGKSDTSHTHDDRYYTETEVTNLLSGKANATHDHDSQYYTKTLTDELLAGKSDTGHNHNSTYYTQGQVDTKLSGKANTTHTHATADVTGLDTALAGKANSTHIHAITDVTDLQTTLAGKSDTGHTHDDRYYTESETDTKLATKVAIAQGSTYAGKILGIDSEGKVTPVDKPVGSVTDVKVNNVSVLVSGVANVPLATGSTAGAVTVNDGTYGLTVSSGNVRVSAANAAAVKAGTHSYAPITPATEHAATFYGLAKAAGDTTQASSSNEVGTYTDTAKQKIQTMLGVSASSHTHDSRYYTETEVDTALAGKSDTGHGHAISDITNLQTTLDGKSATGHTHDDRYFTESEVTSKLATKSDTSHTHDTRYYQQSEIDTKLASKSDTSHNHDTAYYTKSQVDTALSGKSDSTHTHDSRYYTESEIDTKLAGKAASTHSHAITDVTNLQSSLNAKLDINQGTTHADKFLKIGLDGNIVPSVGGAKGEPGVEIVSSLEDAADDTRVAIVDDGTGTNVTLVERSDVAGVLNLDKTATAGYVWKATATGAEWAIGGGGEPAAYVKSASVLGNTLTLTNKDNTTVQFTPTGPDAYLKSATVSGNSLQITNKNNVTTTYTPPVVDVKIGGTSIVSSGTASIPIATESTAGVVKISGANYGIQIDSNSQKISTSGATTSMIDARSNSYCGITPSVLNYAVISALTDSNHITLTDAQKETAQAVLGISSGGGTWGSITGTLSNQTDLQTALNGKSNTGHTHTTTDITGLGSAATASTTTSVTSGSSALITSGAVYTALSSKANSSDIANMISRITNSSSSSTYATSIWVGTEAQLPSTKDSHTLYFVTE